MPDCSTFALSYPAGFCKPDDILHFIESSTFQKKWDSSGLDLEDDLCSLQLCIMANRADDLLIEHTGGVMRHRHTLPSSCED